MTDLETMLRLLSGGDVIGFIQVAGWPVLLVLLGMVMVPAGIVILLWSEAFKNFVYALFSQFTPTLTIRELARWTGVAEVVGKAHSITGQTLRSPLSGQECLYYYYKVEEKMYRGRNTSYWSVIDEETEMVPFGITDGTGMLELDWENIDLQLSPHIRLTTGTITPGHLPPGVVKYLDEREIELSGFFGLSERKLRFTEMIIHPDETLYTLGAPCKVERQGDQMPLVHFGKGGWLTPYVISNRTEEQLYWHWGKDSVRRFALGCGLCLIFGYLCLSVIHAGQAISHDLTDTGDNPLSEKEMKQLKKWMTVSEEFEQFVTEN